MDAQFNAGKDDTNSSLHLVNRLDQSRSPYVRGHMNNPVAWQLWDKQALTAAKKHNKLIFVSIGYAACHWCHVMEHESFESPLIASLLNEHFVPIKIDREERPDIDSVYMSFVQSTTGSGGWPLNVFLTPDLEPVFGGTYFPGPAPSGSRSRDQTTFMDILTKMKTVWQEQEERCRASAKDITLQLKRFTEEGVHSHKLDGRASEELELDLLDDASEAFQRRYDPVNGGFSSAPKFPTPVNLKFLIQLGQWPETVTDIIGDEDCKRAFDMASYTLKKMANGAIRDQIGFGFCRYSVTKDWSLPHFEKMLYDQAQLLDVYVDAYLVSKDAGALEAAHDIATYLTTPPMLAGGICSSEDADSYPTLAAEGNKREGAYYVWTRTEINTALEPEQQDILAAYYGVTDEGNVQPHNDPHKEFVGRNVLKISYPPSELAQRFKVSEASIIETLKSGRERLRLYRDKKRSRPSLDDKVVACWNGLAIGALARFAGSISDGNPSEARRYIDLAISIATFIKQELFEQGTKTLYRVYRSGRGDTLGLCDDYAFLISGLIDLYEVTFDDEHLRFADDLQKIQLQRFFDSERGGFFTTPTPHPPDVLLRLKNGMDAAEPSSNSVSARNLWRLSSMLEDTEYARRAKDTVNAFEAEIAQFPHTFAGMLGSVVMGRLGLKGVILVGGLEHHSAALQKLRGSVRPNFTVISVDKNRGSWLRERNHLLKDIDVEQHKVMVCEAGACREGSDHL